ncbi:MAG: hypothetical protein KDC05_01775 [Bacteroidales bacterium]|nr:hypothetical protein [Bacteroidales bacterium]
MNKIVLNIKDTNKLSFLLQLIRQFDFVEIVEIKNQKKSGNYDLFKSAGLWSGRNIDAGELRDKAWKRAG